MEYRLDIGQEVELEIKARNPYSTSFFQIEQGEKYRFSVNPKDKWTDWFVRSSANGFWHPFLGNKMKRVPGHKCFKLCGTIEKNEQYHFPIGTSREWVAPISGPLYFFPNDSKKLDKHNEFKYYKNNYGCINVRIQRVA